MTKIKIENIVAYAQISELLDIKLLSEKISNSSYDPLEFDGLSIKYDDEKIAVIVLRTGKIVCTGAKETTDATDKIKKVTSEIKKIGFEIKKDYEIKIENITVSTDLKKELHLASIATGLILQNVEYQPDVFAGLTYKMDEFCTILILFSAGKLVCTGAKNIDDATNSIKKMEEKLSAIGAL
ncbi:MAG: TATA-box-binding protein [Epsilonproteobacteria bacterium]|nr:TATA-box-binding protein [Campylobacterota bacterium]